MESEYFFQLSNNEAQLKSRTERRKMLFQARNKTVLHEQSPKATNYETKHHQKNTQSSISFKQTNYKYHVSTTDHKTASLILMQDFKCIQIPQEFHFYI